MLERKKLSSCTKNMMAAIKYRGAVGRRVLKNSSRSLLGDSMVCICISAAKRLVGKNGEFISPVMKADEGKFIGASFRPVAGTREKRGVRAARVQGPLSGACVCAHVSFITCTFDLDRRMREDYVQKY